METKLTPEDLHDVAALIYSETMAEKFLEEMKKVWASKWKMVRTQIKGIPFWAIMEDLPKNMADDAEARGKMGRFSS
jgi:hypothetical protein